MEIISIVVPPSKSRMSFFDGYENLLYDNLHKLDLDGNVLFFYINDFVQINNLNIDKPTEKDIVNALKLNVNMFSDCVFYKTYKNLDALFAIKRRIEDYLICIGIGEIQPGRFQGYLQGVLKIKL